MYLGRGERAIVRGFLVELPYQGHCGAGAGGVTIEGEHIAAVADLDIQAVLDMAEVFVELSAEVRETTGVVGFQREGLNGRQSIQTVYGDARSSGMGQE